MEQIKEGSIDLSLAIVPVSSAAFIRDETPVTKSMQTSIDGFLCPQVKNEVYLGKTLMPVNTKQIKDAWNSRRREFMVINNTAVSSIKVIGQIRGKKTDEYKGIFWIEDCCGAVKASIWFTNGRDELERIHEGSYAAVVGCVKLAGYSPEIQCYDCRPVVNFNDIPHHHLSVIATHIDLVIKPKKGVYARVAEMWAEDNDKIQNTANEPAPAPVKLQNRANPIAIKSPKEEIMSQEQKVQEYAGATSAGSPKRSLNESTMNTLRLQFEKVGPGGVHIDALCKLLKIDKDTTRQTLDELALDGEVYTAVDGDHFAPA